MPTTIVHCLSKRPYEHRAVQFAMLLSLVAIFLMLSGVRNAVADAISLPWNSANDSRINSYEVQYGGAAGQYDSKVDRTAASTSVQIAALDDNATYYFAARARHETGTGCSTCSNEGNSAIATQSGQYCKYPFVGYHRIRISVAS